MEMSKNKNPMRDAVLQKLLQSCKKMNTDAGMYMSIGILSAIIFILIYGIKILNPTYVDWLMSVSDLSQHYLGWVAYRNSEWHFPIGMADTLSYPSKVSVIFTDSIPVFAVLSKLLSPILPSNFQYFGFWGILCFVLQGLFAGRIINSYSKSRTITIITSMIFVFAPVVIHRMYAHTALAGQWLILFGLDLIFNEKKYLDDKLLYKTVAIMGCLAPAIHMYFVFMLGIILVGYVINELLERREVNRSVIVLFGYLISVAAVAFLLGGFSSGVSCGNGGLGVFSFNLNGFFNPFGWSSFLKELPVYSNEQYEGFAYLGAGCVLLFCYIFFYFGKTLSCIENNWRITISVTVVTILSLILALSPVITLNDKIIFEMNLPRLVINLWSIIRSSGRLVWTPYYIIIFVSIIVVLKCANKKSVYAICSLSLVLQFFDLLPRLRGLNERFSHTVQYKATLPTDKFWDSIADNNKIKHIVYSSSVRKLLVSTSNNHAMMYSLTDWALKNGKTVSDFYFARYPWVVESNRKKSFLNLSEDTVFLFTDKDKMLLKKYPLHYYKADGLIIGYKHKLGDFPEMSLTVTSRE